MTGVPTTRRNKFSLKGGDGCRCGTQRGVLVQRGAPSAARLEIRQRNINRIQHRCQIGIYVMIAETNDSIALLVQKCCARSIVPVRIMFGVLIAIKFDHQALPSAAKIREVWPDWMLAAEFKSGKAFRPELRPQPAFNIRCLGTKLSASFASFNAGIHLESRAKGWRADKGPPLGAATAPISPFQVEKLMPNCRNSRARRQAAGFTGSMPVPF
jgi:hypothetical protein